MTSVVTLFCATWSECCQVVNRVPMEVSALLMQRNLLAAHVSALDQLPPMIQEQRTCEHCFQQAACTLLHKVLPASPVDLTPESMTYDTMARLAGSMTIKFGRQWLMLCDGHGHFMFGADLHLCCFAQVSCWVFAPAAPRQQERNPPVRSSGRLRPQKAPSFKLHAVLDSQPGSAVPHIAACC